MKPIVGSIAAVRFALMLAQGGQMEGVRILGPRTVGLMRMNQLPPGVAPALWGGRNGVNGYGFTMSVTTDVAQTTGYGSVGDFRWDGRRRRSSGSILGKTSCSW